MSLQSLISGSECVVANNPLSQVLKHADTDHSVQRDRVGGPSSSRLQHLPSTSTNHASEADVSMTRHFFDARTSEVQFILPPNQVQMLELARRMQMMDVGATKPQAQVQQSGELQDFWRSAGTNTAHGVPLSGQSVSSSSWVSEFGKAPSLQPLTSWPDSHSSQQTTVNSYANLLSFYRPTGYGTGLYNASFPQTFSPIHDQGKGKGKAVDEAFESAFAQFTSESPSQTSSARIEEISDELTELERFWDALREGTEIDERIDEIMRVYREKIRTGQGPKLESGGFETEMKNYIISTRKDAKSSPLASALEDVARLVNTMSDSGRVESNRWHEELMRRFENQRQTSADSVDTAEWEADLQRFLQNQREDVDFDYSASMKEAWESGMGQYDDVPMPSMKFDDEGVPMLDPYAFDAENRYLASPDGPSCLAQAKSLLANNGSLTEAALLIEAAIQKGELGEGGYEAWILLGETRCMDEREEAGMRALTEGIRRAEEAGATSVGLLSLATAFTNEGYERASHAMLLRWLRARHPDNAPSAEEAAVWLRQSHWASREHVTDAFLAVARAQHATGVVDADVQVGLGILFYTNGDFDRAKDCFTAALAVNPRDYLLWNRYGSSLSNGNKPEEALGAYREALQLRPTYTRAIYNVGVACLNIGADKEAAEHFLSALSMQESPSGDKSEQLWFTLRRALIQSGREDLAIKAHSGGDVNAFRAEGFDF